MRIHANKKAIRSLGVAESFRKKDSYSTLAGVVMRSDLIIDGFVFGRSTIEGEDSTLQIARMFSRLDRKDVNLIILQGCVISLYNIVDVDELSKKTRTPVICLTFEESAGIEGAIMHHFPQDHEGKLESYRRLGERKSLTLKTGKRVYVRTSDIDALSAERVLNLFTLQGSSPEPVRLAKLLARAHRRDLSSSSP
jgi:endonuclease V-like protein UPF0215 family